jgi:uncharacterized protein YkwD
MKKVFAILLIIIGLCFYSNRVEQDSEVEHNYCETPAYQEVVIPVSQPQVKSSLPADNLIPIINLYRSEKGLQPFIYNSSLSVGAEKRAKYLVENNQWNHDKFTEHFNQSGFYIGAENLAKNFNSNESIVRAWSLSETHAKFMFSNYYKYAGIGRYENMVVLWMLK